MLLLGYRVGKVGSADSPDKSSAFSDNPNGIFTGEEGLQGNEVI